jgi:hypothetical protein
VHGGEQLQFADKLQRFAQKPRPFQIASSGRSEGFLAENNFVRASVSDAVH